MTKTQYLIEHWKLIIHILIKTKHFGVNNRWWQHQPSVIGQPFYKQLANLLLIYPVIQNYQAMRMRALSGWIENSQAKEWFK